MPLAKGHRGLMRRLGSRSVGVWVLSVWLLGGLLLPVLHQLSHHHAHHHGAPPRRLVNATEGAFFIHLAARHSAAGGHSHHAHHGSLWSRALHWLGHLWSGHEDPQGDHKASEQDPHDPSHGEDSLAHFDLLDKTSVVALFGSRQPHGYQSYPKLRSQAFAALLCRGSHRPRAPPA